jgi:hypothetical protein
MLDTYRLSFQEKPPNKRQALTKNTLYYENRKFSREVVQWRKKKPCLIPETSGMKNYQFPLRFGTDGKRENNHWHQKTDNEHPPE